jgi:mRNA export factor
MFGAAAPAGGINPNKDVQIATPLGDSVSSLSFSPRANLLVATAWDGNVYCWDIQVW